MKQNNLIGNYLINHQLNIEKVMTDFTPYLYTIIQNKNAYLSSEDREEMISDIFLVLWKNQQKLEVDKPMRAYLAGIAQNILHKKWRDLQKDSKIFAFDVSISEVKNIEFELENAEKNDLILHELNQMKLEDREIFMQYYYFSKGMKEIARKLGISEAKVKSRLFRIRRKLKKTLEKRGYENGG